MLTGETLTIEIPSAEYFDEQRQEFVTYNNEGNTITLEHSLASISKWEARNKKSFLGKPGMKEEKTEAELLDYIRCMAVDREITDEELASIKTNPAVLKEIKRYIDDNHTATWFNERSQGKMDRRTITAEVLYDWMMKLNIWQECQHWHLSRLLALIRVRSSTENPNKRKMKQRDILRDNASLNAARHAKYGK